MDKNLVVERIQKINRVRNQPVICFLRKIHSCHQGPQLVKVTFFLSFFSIKKQSYLRNLYANDEKTDTTEEIKNE